MFPHARVLLLLLPLSIAALWIALSDESRSTASHRRLDLLSQRYLRKKKKAKRASDAPINATLSLGLYSSTEEDAREEEVAFLNPNPLEQVVAEVNTVFVTPEEQATKEAEQEEFETQRFKRRGGRLRPSHQPALAKLQRASVHRQSVGSTHSSSLLTYLEDLRAEHSSREDYP